MVTQGQSSVRCQVSLYTNLWDRVVDGNIGQGNVGRGIVKRANNQKLGQNQAYLLVDWVSAKALIGQKRCC